MKEHVVPLVDTFFVSTSDAACGLANIDNNMVTCDILNFGASKYGKISKSDGGESLYALIPDLKGFPDPEEITSVKLVVTVDGDLNDSMEIKVGKIWDGQTWSPGQLNGEIPEGDEATHRYRNFGDYAPWENDKGPVAASDELCSIVLPAGPYPHTQPSLCENMEGDLRNSLIQWLDEPNPGGLIIYTKTLTQGLYLKSIDEDNLDYRPTLEVFYCTNK